MHAIQRLAFDETMQRFKSQRDLANRERLLGADASLTQMHDVMQFDVLGAENDAQSARFAGVQKTAYSDGVFFPPVPF